MSSAHVYRRESDSMDFVPGCRIVLHLPANTIVSWCGLRILTRSRICHIDGPLSVRAAFTLQEMQELATRAELTGATLTRHKLCGACLNGDAIAGIRELGLAESFARLGGLPLNEFRLRTAGRSMSLQLPAGIAVTRRRFDAMLVESAVQACADFLSGVSLDVAAADPDDTCRHLTTSDHNNPGSLRAHSVVLASGLAADRRTHDPALAVVTGPASRIGAGTTTFQFPDEYHGRRGRMGRPSWKLDNSGRG